MKLDPNITINIIDLVKTTKDRTQFLTILDNLSNISFTKEKDIEDAINICLPYWKKDVFLKLFKIFSPGGAKIEHFHDFTLKLKETINTISEVSITLAFEPTTETTNSISGWFLMHKKKPVILDIHLDPEIIGGCIVMYKGKYKDFSVKKKLERLAFSV